LINLKSAFETFVIIFLKELKHAFRDKDVIIYTVIVPAVLYPLLMVGGIEIFVIKQEADDKKVITFALLPDSGDKVRAIDALLSQKKQYKKVEATNGTADLFNGRVSMLLHEVKQSSEDAASKGKAMREIAKRKIALRDLPAIGTATTDTAKKGDDTNVEALVARSTADVKSVDNLNELLRKDYKEALNQAFKEKGFGPSAVEVNQIEQENVNKQKKEVFSLGLALLFFSLFNVALGAAYPAISATSEEFERNSIEAILTLPINRWFFLAAKLSAVVLLALLAGSLNLFSMYGNTSLVVLGGGSLPVVEQFKPDFKLLPGQIPWVSLAYLAISVIFASILMMTAACCRTVRSSQQWVSFPLTIFILLPFLAIMPQLELTYTTALIPVLGNILTLRSLFNGDHISWLHAISFLEAIIMVAIAVKIASVLVFERFEGQWRF